MEDINIFKTEEPVVNIFQALIMVVLIIIVTTAKADMNVFFQYGVFNNKTKAGIPGAVITDTFTDENSKEQKKTDTCTTNENGVCMLKPRFEGGVFFTGYSFAWSPTVEKEGYLKQKTFTTERVDQNNYIIRFFLSKPDETIHTVKYYSDHFTVKDDELEVTAKIDTAKAHKGITRAGQNLTFLRGFVDKKVGTTAYQVYVLLTYKSEGFQNFTSGTAATPNGPIAVIVKQIDRNVDCQNKVIDKQCTYQETIGIDLSESLIRELADVYQPMVEKEWKFRVNSHSGTSETLSLPYAEIAAFVEKMTSYSAELKR